MHPTYLTHYYHDAPFQCITSLSTSDMVQVIRDMHSIRQLPRRLLRPIYFMERRQYERKMREQFLAKGGFPQRLNPHYLVLGESEAWERQQLRSIRIPLSEIPPDVISFTFTDSWFSYVEFDLNGEPIPRESYSEMVYRVDELNDAIDEHKWPGNKNRSNRVRRDHDYIEAQVWADEPLQKQVNRQKQLAPA